ncbi:MAG: hypothetical protein V4736_04135 [Bdellovibrionota bacterium]
MNKHRLQISLLTFACLLTGYGFYKMNPHDPIIAVVFTIGALGIMLSVLRNKKPQ